MATDNRYAHGKVYKLVNDIDAEIYVGSTCLPLHKRLYTHKKKAKEKPDRNVYQHLNEIGFDNVQIILIENYACDSKEVLLARERHWIDTLMPSLNQNLPLRTNKEWRETNKDKVRDYLETKKDIIREQMREYREAHKDKIREYREANKDKRQQYQRDYCESNRDKILEQTRKYHEANKDAINARRRERYAQKKAEREAQAT